MFKVNLESARLNEKLREYAKLANKAAADAVKEEATFVAERLVKLTPPKKASEGKKRVAIDIGKVYLASKWFLEIFNFRNKQLDDRVKEGVRKKDSGELNEIFKKSGKLKRIVLEPFGSSRHKRLRKHGRIAKNWHPGSYPLNQQPAVKKYERQKAKLVGMAKAGWAAGLQALGKSVAGWINRQGVGAIKNDLKNQKRPSVTLINKVPYMADLDGRKKIIVTVLKGRQKALEKKMQVAVRLAARAARLS